MNDETSARAHLRTGRGLIGKPLFFWAPLLCLALLLSACVSTGQRTDIPYMGQLAEILRAHPDLRVPDAHRLEERIEAFYAAESRRDADAMLSITLPGETRTMWDEPLQRIKQGKTDRVVSWSVRDLIEGKGFLDGYDREGCDSGLCVPMRVELEDKAGKRRPGSDQLTDYWVHKGREWFWVWRGCPTD